jgi:two-component system sensor histidine kinase KdpD
VASGLIVFGVTLISLSFAPLITTELIGLLELFAVLLIAYFFGRGPALLAAAISALSWNYLFIEPRFTLQIGRPQDIVLLALYFAIALFTGNLTARIRRHERQSRRNAERTMALYALAHEVASAVDMDAVLLTAVREIGRAFNAEVGILIAGEHGLQAQTCSTLPMNEKELSVAKWAYESGKPAGRFTDTLPSAAATHLPLNTGQATVGVLAIRTAGDQRLSFDQMGLLDTFTNQLAVVVEREILDQQMERAEMARESERLYTALLNSISHELRTPIATVVGASTSLRDLPAGQDGLRRTLIADIQHAGERLNRLVENLLDMSRLESGRLQIKREWCDIGDLIGVVVKEAEGRLGGRAMHLEVEPGLPLVQLDEGLIEQALANLLDNAINYAPAHATIRLSAQARDGWVELAVEDNGPGIPPADLPHLFDKFYRGAAAPTGGTGLGLAIARGLVEAHGGTLGAVNVPGGGARFTIRLPASAAPPPVQEADA